MKKSKNIGSSVIDLVCVAWEVWYVEAGLQADHRMVTGTLKTRKKKEGKKKASEKKAWRRRDKGDLSFWEDLVEE